MDLQIKKKSVSIRIRGTVQGVGFRPFVYRLAIRFGINGSVKNDAEGVLIDCFGEQPAIDQFTQLLRKEAPPLSIIRSIETSDPETVDKTPSDFTIAESEKGGRREIDIARDTATCEPCLIEMRDPHNRRYGHPFINCTDCGPRYTIIKALPYDRPATAMAEFPMCDACKAEYGDPVSRRFHAQPVCCPFCGPRMQLLDRDGKDVSSADPVARCIDSLKAGGIVAIKGVGGFHLACRADNSETINRLRERKQREEKPFALMARNRTVAEEIALVSAEEARLLESIERPIVLLEKRHAVNEMIADEIAPGLKTLGVMLPYTPLHHLLFDKSEFNLLIMTSANRTDEPMARDNDDALAALGGIADAFLLHNRPVLVRTDDSIAKVAAGSPVLLRRGRGYVPDPLPSPCDIQGIVGCGGVLKSTVSVGRGTSCYVSQYAGNAENAETLSQLDGIKNHLLKVLGTSPSLYVADLHPDTLSSRIAGPGIPLVRVQHHHAHAAACMAENNITAPAVCVVYDGTGYGTDGTMWGGEIFAGDYTEFTRSGHLVPMLLPGGDAGIRNPWRIAMGALLPLMGERVLTLFPQIPNADRAAVFEMLAQNVSCVLTSGMGRLFDAMSALLGICVCRTYEGQPAIMLEAAADPGLHSAYDPQVKKETDSGTLLVDGRALLHEALEDYTAGTAPAVVAARFHETIAKATALAAGIAAGQGKTDKVCLSGGCFQNTLLLERTIFHLQKAGLRPVVHRLMPPNDESISYGQVIIAGMRRAASSGK